jgi:glycosyltransferase involved in cell wall biosynthesis
MVYGILMKILVIVPEYYPLGSGIGMVSYELNMSLRKLGANVDVISKSSIFLARYSPGLFGLLPFWQCASLVAARKGSQYDAIWLHAPLLPMPYALRNTIKLILTFHSTYYGFYQALKCSGAPPFLVSYYSVATKIEHQFLDKLSRIQKSTWSITAVSPTVANELKLNGFAGDIKIIPNSSNVTGTNLDKQEARAFIRNKYSICLDSADKVLIYIGRLSEIKRPYTLLKLFEKISDMNSKYKLFMVGNGELLDKLKHLKPENVYFFSKVAHELVPIFLRASDAFISLSSYEGLPTTVLEALNMGIPLILSKISSHEWVAMFSSNSTLLVNHCEVLDNTMILKITSFLNECKVNNKHNLVSTLNWNSVAFEYLKCIQS